MGDRNSGTPEGPVAPLRVESKADIPLPQTEDAISKADSKWNTKNLAFRLAADLASAASAASLVAPLISIIDRLATNIPFITNTIYI